MRRVQCRVDTQLQFNSDGSDLVRSFFRHPSVSYLSDDRVTEPLYQVIGSSTPTSAFIRFAAVHQLKGLANGFQRG